MNIFLRNKQNDNIDDRNVKQRTQIDTMYIVKMHKSFSCRVNSAYF